MNTTEIIIFILGSFALGTIFGCACYKFVLVERERKHLKR